MHCQSCGAPYPEYVVVSQGRKKGRRSSKKTAMKSRGSRKPGKSTAGTIPTLEQALKGETAPAPGKAKEAKPAVKFPLNQQREGGPNRKATILVTAALLLAAVTGGGAFYLKQQAEEKYLKNFALATYCVQSGEDQAVKASQRMIGEWKAKMNAGQAYNPRLSPEEERGLNRVSTNLNDFKSNLKEEPAKFNPAAASLAKIEGSYGRLRSLVQAPGTSLPGFADSASKLDAEYKSSAKDFRASLPVEVMDELTRASKKFMGLRPLLK